MSRPRKPGQTSIVVRLEDRAKLDALGVSATEAVREFCDARGPDGMLIAPTLGLSLDDHDALEAIGMTPVEAVRAFLAGEAVDASRSAAGFVVLVDPGARDPSDRKPDKPPAGCHGWRNIGARLVARASSIAEIVALDAEVGGSARLGSPYVTLTAEVPRG